MYIYINLHAIMLQSYKKNRYERAFFTYSLHFTQKKANFAALFHLL